MKSKVIKLKELIDVAKKWGVRGLGRLRRSELVKVLVRLLPERPVRELMQLGRKMGLDGLSGLRKNELVKRIVAFLQGEEVAAKTVGSKNEILPQKEEQKTVKKGKDTTLRTHAGSGKLELVARDPNWLYAWWDFSSEIGRRLTRPGTVPVLRVVAVESDGSERQVARIDLPLHARSWHLRVDHGAARYRAYLELRHSGGATEVVLISQVTRTPADMPASQASIMVADASGKKRPVPPPSSSVQQRLQKASLPPSRGASRMPSSVQEAGEIPPSAIEVPSSH